MSRIAALAAICLAAACATDPELACGDDAGHVGGLEVSFEGRVPDTTYDFAIGAEGASLVLSSSSAEPASADLGDGRQLVAQNFAADRQTLLITVFEDAPAGERDGRDSQNVPAQASVVVSVAGAEVGRATFTPTFQPMYPWGEACDVFFAQAAATMTLAAPP